MGEGVSMSMLWLEVNQQVSKGQTLVLSKSYGKGGSSSKTVIEKDKPDSMLGLFL